MGEDGYRMTDPEALAAALDRRDEWLRRPDTVPMYSVVIEAAARERLAQLPEKCGTCEGSGHIDAVPKRNGTHYLVDCPACHGKGVLYPPALVERIAAVLHGDPQPRPRCEQHDDLAVAVLDALNGETP